MKKRNYTGLVTEYVSLKPIYNLMDDIIITASQDDASGAFVEEDEHGGSWEGIWEAE